MKIKIQLLAILFLVLFFELPKIGLSGAYLSDSMTLSGISITTGTWDADQSDLQGQQLSLMSLSAIVSEGVNLDFYLHGDNKAVGFKVSGIDLPSYNSLDYQITYDSDQTEQGITGTKIINGAREVDENDLLLGTCSSGGTCVFNTGVKTIDITVTLHGSTDKILIQEITL